VAKGPSVQLVFGFEYALLITLVATAAFKYILHSVDVYSDTFWESKAVLLLYLEFFIGNVNLDYYSSTNNYLVFKLE
jgi:E3 ubiquitin-protein ligase synoviolin